MTPSPIDLNQIIQWLPAVSTTFVLVFLAELGDKTQIVCMTLAARHRPWPVFWGALLAFVLLNTLAVLFGAALSSWIPRNLLIILVAGLFAVFGVQSLRSSEDDEEEEEEGGKSGGSILISAFLLIFLAELGDKTQIAVAGLATTQPPIPVWVGGTVALGLSSALAVLVGKTLLQKIPMKLLSRITGILFLLLAIAALTQLSLPLF